MTAPLQIGMLLYPQLTQLDLTGPYEVLARMPNTEVHLLWKRIEPIVSDQGLVLTPTMTLDRAPQFDVLFVPGGPGQVSVTDDEAVMRFVRLAGESARYVTAVCTGSLVLAAAGLLDGYTAACHWLSREFLEHFGVKVSAERVVVDRNRITGGGVTAGIDFALQVCALLHGDEEARRIQLQIEYNPSPPFSAGSPETASPEVVDAVRHGAAALLEARRLSTERALMRLRASRL